MNNYINQIKIFGERNSGTGYIEKLLQKNISNIHIHPGNYKNKLGWKHGIPYSSKIDKQKTLILFVVRNLEEWLNSMYFRPYHLKRKKDFIQFITTKNKSSDKRKNHPVNLYEYERRNIFQIRYRKFKKYLDFLETHNCILLNLNFIQQYPKRVIELINHHFNIKTSNKFIPILKHTKINKKIQNDPSHQKYKIPPKIYEEYASHKIETYINNLTYKINKI